MRIIHTTWLIILASLSFNQKVFAQVQTDFDGDGKSDYTIVKVAGDKSLNWISTNSLNSTENAMGSLGNSDDHIALAPWKGTGKAQIGVVGVSDNNKELVWKIKNDLGETEERQFGKSNYTALAGGDFDGNGKADAAVAVLKQQTVQWQISFDMFDKLVGQESISTINFGQSGDRVFYASPDGVSDYIGTVGKGVNGKGVLLRLKSLRTGAVQSSTKFPKYIVTGTRPRPFPVKNPEGKDYLAFARVTGKKTIVDIRTVEGTQIAQVEFSGKGDVVAGNFTDDAGEEVAIKTSTGYSVFSPTSKLTTEVSAIDGVAVDEVNVNTFSQSSGGGNSGGGSSGEGSPPPSGNNACNSAVSWPSSHIYKTIGSHHFTDIRRNTSGIIVKRGGRGPFPTCVDIVDTKGNVVAKMGRYAIGEGLWAARFYAGIGCGSGTPYGGSTVASRARANTGSSYIYANFGSVCYGPIEASRCIGSSAC